VKVDFRLAALSAADRLMLEFVEKLTLAPWLVEEPDVVGLRRAGWSDPEVLHIVLGCAHFNYLNRMADGTGIRSEYASALPASPPRAPRAPVEGSPPVAPEGGERMAWIGTTADAVESDDPDEPVNLLRAMGANPEAAAEARRWRAHQLAGTPDLEAPLRARIALFVAALDRCAYGLGRSRRRLEALGAAGGLEALLEGRIPERSSGRERLVLAHARQLTRAPGSTREAHVQELRAAGLDDTAVVRLTMLVSYLSFEHRVALGLGVVPERPQER
jgi:alkylhydroperoxidase family enzyme